MEPIQVSDPEVSKVKFERELEKWRAVEDKYKTNGILCTEIAPLRVSFLFSVPKLIPQPIMFSVRIDFTNFDADPPSVIFINPFTNERLKREQIPIHFIQINNANFLQPQELVQGGGNIMPFFCIPGVKEYHDHPAHSGDSWFLYRTKGEGGLLFILDQLYTSSIPLVNGFNINVNLPTIRVNQEIKLPQINIVQP
jgi:hypothetical protein